jgi:predicted DNA-binding helix-hairpin-helix protein
MDDSTQLQLLTKNMHLESDGDDRCQPVIGGRQVDEIPITEAQLPNGQRIKLLKTLLSSACERNCFYCPFRAGRDMPRATFKPEQMAKTFISIHDAGLVEGIFLSSGVVGGGVRTQDLLIDTAAILRKKYRYRGYLHLKIMPGAGQDQVARAMHYASRISVNLEAPNTARLQLLAPRKAFTEELLQPLIWAEEIRTNRSSHRTWNGRWPSSTTQFVVGAVGESDLELLSTSEYLYRNTNISRAYYSRFNPIEDTPFEDLPPASEMRQHRLYQASFLIRDYGFELEEMPFSQAGFLPRAIDPKLAWAQAHLLHTPMEINSSNKQELIRVPGIGPKGAFAIMKHRQGGKLRSLGDLRKLGIQAARVAPFILLNGRRPPHQPALFSQGLEKF